MHDIVLLHGALGSSHDLKPLGECLLKLNFCVHYLTFSGHQSVPFRAEFGIHQFAKEVEEFILAKNIKGCTVFGYSMGGYVALYLASSKKDLIGKVITLGTKFDWNSEAIERESGILDFGKITENQPTFARSLQSAHASWEMLVNKTQFLIRNFSKNRFLDDYSLSRITIPVFLGLGEKDRMVTKEETDKILRHVANSECFFLQNARHQLSSVDPQALSHAINDFITN